LIWNNEHGTELVACGSDVVTSYNPDDGAVNWRVSGMRSGFSGSPAMDPDRIYFGMSGPSSPAPLVAIDAGLTGDIPLDRKFESEKIAWSRTQSGPGMASPVTSNGLLYIPGSGGILNCYDTKTGERVYRKRVNGMKTVVASLWADENRLFILDEAGTTFVIKSGPEFELLETNKLDDLVWSTPTIAGDTLLIRGVDKLYCIRK
jgi:outer membrane protein assembly factor BamB